MATRIARTSPYMSRVSPSYFVSRNSGPQESGSNNTSQVVCRVGRTWPLEKAHEIRGTRRKKERHDGLAQRTCRHSSRRWRHYPCCPNSGSPRGPQRRRPELFSNCVASMLRTALEIGRRNAPRACPRQTTCPVEACAPTHNLRSGACPKNWPISPNKLAELERGAGVVQNCSNSRKVRPSPTQSDTFSSRIPID